MYSYYTDLHIDNIFISQELFPVCDLVAHIKHEDQNDPEGLKRLVCRAKGKEKCDNFTSF